MFGKKTLASRLKIYTLILIAVPPCLSVLAFMLVTKEVIAHNTHRDMVVELQHHRATTELWLQHRLSDVTFFAQKHPLATHDIAKLQENLQTFLDYHVEFHKAFYVSPDGKTFVSPTTINAIDLLDRPYFLEARQGRPSISDLLLGRDAQQPLIIFAAPLPFKDGKFQGVFLGALGLEPVNERLVGMRRTPNDQSFLATRNGALLTSRLLNGKTVLPQYDEKGNPIYRVTMPPLDSLQTPRWYKNASGVYVLGVQLPLKNGEWVLIQERQMLEVMHGYLSIIIMSLAGGVASLIILSPFLFKIAKRITVPLEKLTTMSEKVTHGDFDPAALHLEKTGMTLEIRKLYESFCFMATRVTEQMRELERISFRDTLTDLHNRRFLAQEGPRTIAQCERGNAPCSCLMLDVDHFKQINDTWGHSIGDLVLQKVASVLSKTIRLSDISIRMGGEEFAILAPYTGADAALILAERIRSAIEATAFYGADAVTPIHVTLSIGVAELSNVITFGSTKLDDLLLKADSALYLAKQNGRNRIEMFKEDAPANGNGQEG